MKPSLVVIAFLCLLSGPVPVRAAMTQDDRVFYGTESLARGHFSQAIQAFSDVLAQDPDNSYAKGRLALALADAGQRDKARHELEKALADRGDDLFALWTLGCLDLLDEQPLRAHDRFAAMLAADPDNARGTLGLGLAELASGHTADGIAQLAKLQNGTSQDGLVHHLAGLAFFLLDAPANARLELETTLELEPRNAAALELLGLVYRRLGKNALAKSAWGQALTIDPGRVRAKFFLSRLAEDEGLAATLADQPQEAQRAYARALAIDPSNAAAAKALGLPTLPSGPAVGKTDTVQPSESPAQATPPPPASPPQKKSKKHKAAQHPHEGKTAPAPAPQTP